MRWIIAIVFTWSISIMAIGLTSMAYAKKSDDMLKKAYFAGGCFWCIEAEFEQTDGVREVTSGYMGGDTENPTYSDVGSKNTGHYEAVEVLYAPSEVTYETLLKIYWSNIDPLDAGGQFNDRGSPYYTAIFTMNDEEKALAQASKRKSAKKLNVAEEKIATKILPHAPFYPAEAYHQDYYKKNKIHYTLYKHGSGRVGRLKELWENNEE